MGGEFAGAHCAHQRFAAPLSSEPFRTPERTLAIHSTAGTQIYDAKEGGFKELSILDVMQIFGRAGRPQYDTSGEGIIITTHDKLNHYLALMNHQMPIESQFISCLPDHLNAEIVLGTVTSVKEASAWLSYTYLYIRMLRNPLVYGITWDAKQRDPLLVEYRQKLIESAAKELQKAKMARFTAKSGDLGVTDLGRVASHYYITHGSIEVYNELLTQSMTDRKIFFTVANSREFANIKLREEESAEVETLRRTSAPIPIVSSLEGSEMEEGVDDKLGKINVLLQAFISRARVDSFSLISDSMYAPLLRCSAPDLASPAQGRTTSARDCPQVHRAVGRAHLSRAVRGRAEAQLGDSRPSASHVLQGGGSKDMGL